MMSFEDAMLETAWKSLELQEKRYKDIDDKAIAIITVTGILISFLVGSESLVESKTSGPWILFILTSFSFLVTVFLSIIAIRIKSVKMISSS